MFFFIYNPYVTTGVVYQIFTLSVDHETIIFVTSWSTLEAKKRATFRPQLFKT